MLKKTFVSKRLQLTTQNQALKIKESQAIIS